MGIFVLLSFLPLIVFSWLLIVKKASILKSSAVTFFLYLFLSLLIWRINPASLFNSFTKGLFTSLDILLIIFGAIYFLDLLSRRHTIDHLIRYLESVSPDYRIQTIFLAWFLEDFIEGIAGFGTPSTIVAPILVALGLSPIAAVVLALFGNSVAVAFGAAGTPIRVGFASLDYSGVPLLTAAYNWVGLLVPVFMSWFVVRTLKKPQQDFWEILPFSLWSGFVFVLCSYLTVFLGQEFPSIVGSIISFLLILVTTKIGFLVPRHPQPFAQNRPQLSQRHPLLVLLPYIVLILLLVIGKFTLGSLRLSLFDHQVHSFNFFNPGLMFLLTSLIFALFWKVKYATLKAITATSIKKTIDPFLVILLMSTMVQVMTLSGNNASGLISLINTLAIPINYLRADIIAPIMGAFGSFITGSATISNIMFGQLLQQAAQSGGVSSAKVLSLELVGAGFGNMIALSDLITAETVVGLKGEESRLVKIIAPYCFILLAILILLALFAF